METKIKWNEGEGYITATYEGSGNGSASISSDVNEGIDREQSIKVETTDKSVSATLMVSQEGLREVFEPSDGLFVIADGGTFNVLKVGGVIPDEPQKEYEEIEYVTFDGTLIFDTMQHGNNTTKIWTKFQRTDTSGAHYLFGCSSGSRVTGYLTASGYWRYGAGYPTFNTANTNITEATVTPGETTVGKNSKTFSYGNAFTTPFTIPVGGHKPSSGVATPQFKGYLFYFKMEVDGVVVVDWIPVRRLSDGLECFWDKVTQSFVEPI